MKRTYLILIAIFLCALLCLAFSSCGGGGTPEGDDTENSEHTHIYGGWTTTREATCTQEGERKQVCTCGDFKTEAIPTIAHTLVDVEGRAPTCEKPGRTPGKNCSVCGTIIIAQRIIPPTGHEEKILPRKEATCKETGLTEGKGCANCDVVITNQEILPIVSCNIVDGFCTMCKVSYVNEGLIFKVSDDMTYAILTDVGMCTDNVIYIPATYQNLPVKEIGEEAFAYTASITEVHLPSSLEVIGEGAFESCPELEKLYLTKGLKQTGNDAFRNCPKLKDVYYSGKIEEWCVIDFGGYMPLCNKANLYIEGQLLTSLVFPDSVTEIKRFAFADCASLTSVVIPNSVTVVSYSIFNGCTWLTIYCEAESQPSGWDSGWRNSNCPVVWNCKNNDVASNGKIYLVEDDVRYSIYEGKASVEIQSTAITTSNIKEKISYKGNEYTVTTIVNSAFSGCTGLTSVTIGDSVTSIGSSAFYNCTGLTKVDISDVGAWCNISFGNSYSNPLYYAKNLYLNGELVTDLVIPNSVTAIGARLFENCTSLTSVTIGDSVTSIGDRAFYGCTNLEEITVPFVGNGSDQTYFGYIFGASSYSYNNSYVPTSLKKVTISGDTIGSNAFYNCKSLTSVTIGNSVTSIVNSAFYNCTGLARVDISDIGVWCNISFGNYYANPLYYAENLYLNGELVTDLVIPNSITTINNYAFRYCTGLTSVTIPNSVTSIGKNAFEDCTGLEEMTIPFAGNGRDQTHFGYIFGASSYSDNKSYVPTSLKKVTVLGGEIGNYAFYNCTGLTSVTIPNSVTSIGNYAFRSCTSLTSVTIGDSVTSIGSYAFCYCTGLTSIEMPNSVTTIGDDAFCYCTGLTSIEIPNSVTTIGDDAFYDCTGLTRVDISDIGAWCNISFGNYYSNPLSCAKKLYLNGELVTDLVISNNITSISSYAFYNCKSLTSVTIPNSITTIDSYAFENCKGLTSVTIPNSVTSIGGSAFRNCTSLTIYCEATSKPSGWNSKWNYSNCPVVWDYKNK